MDIQQLRYFKRVVDDGSLSKAAASFFMTPQAMRKQINNLENEIGVEILTRPPPRVFSLAMRGERFTTMPSVSSP